MERIPILQMGEFLLVTIQLDMHDGLAMTLQEDLTDRIVQTHTRGVLIDISALEIVDSFMGRVLGNIARCLRSWMLRRSSLGCSRSCHHIGGIRGIARGDSHGLKCRKGHGTAAIVAQSWDSRSDRPP